MKIKEYLKANLKFIIFLAVFGHLYQKYGIGYAMLAHIGVHLVSKIIWLVFI